MTGVTRKLGEANARKQAAVERGMKKGGLLIFRESQKEVPVDQGPLKASGFIRTTGKGVNTKLHLGYGAAYAIFVHENLDALHGAAFNAFHADEIRAGHEHSRGPNQKAKFLEGPARRNAKTFKNLVADEAKRA